MKKKYSERAHEHRSSSGHYNANNAWREWADDKQNKENKPKAAQI